MSCIIKKVYVKRGKDSVVYHLHDDDPNHDFSSPVIRLLTSIIYKKMNCIIISKEQELFTQKLLTTFANIPFKLAISGNLSCIDWENLDKAKKKLEESNIYIENSPKLNNDSMFDLIDEYPNADIIIFYDI